MLQSWEKSDNYYAAFKKTLSRIIKACEWSWSFEELAIKILEAFNQG